MLPNPMAEPTEANTNDQLDDQRCRAPAAMKTTPAILPSFGLACCAAGVLRVCRTRFSQPCRPNLGSSFTGLQGALNHARSPTGPRNHYPLEPFGDQLCFVFALSVSSQLRVHRPEKVWTVESGSITCPDQISLLRGGSTGLWRPYPLSLTRPGGECIALKSSKVDHAVCAARLAPGRGCIAAIPPVARWIKQCICFGRQQ
jgi:hypothetical protein